MNDSVIYRSFVTGEYYSVPCRVNDGHSAVIINGTDLDKIPSVNELRGFLRQRARILIVG